ncbi:sentrin-specific protease 8-like protein [Gorgonomyces haynaldii]|nr:sentrin-specific protease 8-like protein [Gorgonomyces haynaldii]
MLLYGDVQLYQEDLKLLKPGQWLNDTIIEFYFELIEKQYDRICFVRPAIAYLLKEVPESVPLPESDLYLIPVNDNTGNRVGGSHWSLLVLDKTHNKFYHLDSMNSNHRAAASYWKAFSFLSKGDLMHPSVPQQQNGSDCGVHISGNSNGILNGMTPRL